MKITGKHIFRSWFKVYWKLVAVVYLFEALILFLWFNAALGECRFNGSNMEQCFLLGMNVDGVADTFISMWMIPIIGIFFGLLVPPLWAFWPSVFIWVPFFAFEVKKLQELPEPPVDTMPKIANPTVTRGD